jgi:hypothetical protein
VTDAEIRAYRDVCREFISESRLALGEVTSSPDAVRAAERAAKARARCTEILNARKT